MPEPSENKTQDKLLELYSELPKDVQDAMIAMDTANVIYETADKEGVLPMVSLLAEITGDVMLGILPITEFRGAIQEELGIDEEKARRIAQAIRDKVFAGIADSLRKIHSLP